MFKDYDKYLSTSLKVYLFVLIFIFILKLTGLDYFGIEITNPVIIILNDFCLKYNINYLWYFFSLYLQFHLYLCIVCDRKKLYLYSLIGTIINSLIQIIIYNSTISNDIYSILSILVMIIIPMIVNKKFMIKKQIKFVLIITLYQIISLLIRNVNINYNEWNFIIDTILNFDQTILLLITYDIYFKKGEILICGQEAGLSLPKKKNLKLLLKKLQKSWHNFRTQDKVTKLTYFIYFILSLFWNIITIVSIFVFAKLNNTLIECIFICTSFWLSKKAFGKAFHLSSMLHCFIVSNITYYVLNRVTTPLGISIVIPILLGVGLSYVTSKLVKKTYKPLYRGMPEDLFEETILKVVDKDSLKYKICYDFYINKKSVISLAMKYNYTEAGIRKIKDRVNEKIKGLN